MAKKVKVKAEAQSDEAKVCKAPPPSDEVVDPRKSMRETVNLVLSDGLMIFLAIMLIPIILLPILFNLPVDVTNFLFVSDLIVLAIFYIEYFLKLYLAKDRWAHFKDPWHILDLVIIMIPLLELFPILGVIGTRTSPLLRLFRLARLFAVGGRTVKRRVTKHDEIKVKGQGKSIMKIRALDGSLHNIKAGVKLEEIPKYLEDGSQTWIEISDVSDVDIEGLSQVLNIPVALLQSKLVEEAFPRIDYLESSSLVFLQAGELECLTSNKDLFTVTKTGMLIVCSGANIITISRESSEEFEEILKIADKRPDHDKHLTVTILYSIMTYVIGNYKTIVQEIEKDLIRLENIPRDEHPADFLETTFHLKKEVTRLSSSLHHLKEVVDTITSKRVPLQGFDKGWGDLFDILLDETGYLYETTQNSKENLLSLIDLHINMTSYEMNKVMRFLAVITCLALIPTVIGGMLGMNILGIPSSIQLWQVVSLTLVLMAAVAWTFFKLDWLRT
jgi:Mg2+ and Co2+ transporter CorA